MAWLVVQKSKTVSDTFEYFKKTISKDIYLPLIKYHGKGFFPFGYNISKAKNKLLNDLNSILNFGYSKVYVFAASHSALQIINMSIEGKLDTRLKLIFISPQVYTKIFFFSKRYICCYSFFWLQVNSENNFVRKIYKFSSKKKFYKKWFWLYFYKRRFYD